MGLQSAVASPRADERAYRLAFGRIATPANAFWMVHPLIVDMSSPRLHLWQNPGRDLPDDASRLDILKKAPYLELPSPVLPSISSLADNKIYLVDTCLSAFILIGKNVPEEEIVEIQNDDKFRNVLTQLQVWSQVGREPRWLRPVHLPAVSVRPDDLLYQLNVVRWLVADPSHGEHDYVNFVLELQRQVQQKQKA